jgi:hypothetical protein
MEVSYGPEMEKHFNAGYPGTRQTYQAHREAEAGEATWPLE